MDPVLDRTLRLNLRDVILARRTISPWIAPTPTRTYEALDRWSGLRLVLKHENESPTGAFKIRGSLNLLSKLSEQGVQTVCTASTGNLGLGVACAAKLIGMRAVVCVPEGANSQKVAAIESYGATMMTHGKDFDEAREWIQSQAGKLEATFVGTTAPEMIAGNATHTLELLLEHPDVDVIVVPVGGGSGVCGAAIVAKAIDPAIAVIGVQSAQAPAMQKAWSTGDMSGDRCATYAEGIATRVPFANTMEIMRRVLDDFVLVDDREILDAQTRFWQLTQQRVEAASAAPLAAVLKNKSRFEKKRVALILTGGNASHAETDKVNNHMPR